MSNLEAAIEETAEEAAEEAIEEAETETAVAEATADLATDLVVAKNTLFHAWAWTIAHQKGLIDGNQGNMAGGAWQTSAGIGGAFDRLADG